VRDTVDQHRAVLALLPFLVKGALSLSVLRAMRSRGLKVFVAYFLPEAVGYTRDTASDFIDHGQLLDFTQLRNQACIDSLNSAIEEHEIGLVLQIGAFNAYPALGYLKDKHPSVQIVDILYNEIGHTVDHFLYEACFDAVIVESRHMQRFVETSSAKLQPNVKLVESGIDLDQFRYCSPRSAFGNLILGYVGRMSPEKGPMAFVDLAVALAPYHPTATFVMYGEGGMSTDVQERVSATGLGDRLIFNGYVKDVRDALRSIDVLVVPSKIDGRPNAIMEANAMGRPVLACPVGGIPEMIVDGQNGHLISINDVAHVSQILDSWITIEFLLEKESKTSRELAERSFDRRRMLDVYESTFQAFSKSR
jgi:glycosyltransferase involved in cell wall biosynthesis